MENIYGAYFWVDLLQEFGLFQHGGFRRDHVDLRVGFKPDRAAGSLLGVALNRKKYSFPVGKVDMMTFYQLDFEEFHWETGNVRLCELI